MSPVPKVARTAVHGTQSRHLRPPLLSPVGSRVRFEDAMPSPAPPAQPWSQVSVAPRTQTPLRNALPSESGPCAPPRVRLWLPWSRLYGLWGHGMASAAAVTSLGLLHMRPLQHWLHDRVPRWAWQRGTYRVSVTPSYRQTFGPWSDLAFLRAGVPLVQVSRHVVVSTDASAMGWGAMCNGHAAAGLWTGSRLQWHVNCLELLAVRLALRRFKGLLHDKHVLVRTDNTATVAYINHQGGLCSRRLSQLARHLLLWSQKHLRSLRTVHIPGELNRAADELSRQPALPGEWRLHPEVVQLIWRRFGDAQVDLFASPDTFHCQLFTPCPRGPSARKRWHTAGLGAYANMRFPQ